eukprot:GHVT01059674.1.p1 GENE.GHVT01059674.1~~GHVT01059674.1.p1  ORF type:complete len:587 (-),score=46.38 GHVT01059674.1:3581-5341(-)
MWRAGRSCLSRGVKGCRGVKGRSASSFPNHVGLDSIICRTPLIIQNSAFSPNRFSSSATFTKSRATPILESNVPKPCLGQLDAPRGPSILKRQENPNSQQDNKSISKCYPICALLAGSFSFLWPWNPDEDTEAVNDPTDSVGEPSVAGQSGQFVFRGHSADQKRRPRKVHPDESDQKTTDPAPDAHSFIASFYQEPSEFSDFQIFTGTTHPELAREICAHLGICLGRAYVAHFADGETSIQIMDEVRGRDVFVIQSLPRNGGDIHNALMELFLMITSLRRSSAKRLTAVVPYLPYARQTHQYDVETAIRPIAAAEIAILLQTCGVDRVVFVDLHNARMEGFFTRQDGPPLPVSNIQPHGLAVEYFKTKELVAPVVVATENTGGERSMAFWTRLKRVGIEAGFTTMVSNRIGRAEREGGHDCPEGGSPSRKRPEEALSTTPEAPSSAGADASETDSPTSSASGWNLVGDVKGCDCIIVDDIIDTGERAENTARQLRAAGAQRIFMYATNGLFSKGAIERLNNAPIEEVVVTNTVPIPPQICCEKLQVLSIGKLLAEAIRRVHTSTSVSPLHKDEIYERNIRAERLKQ